MKPVRLSHQEIRTSEFSVVRVVSRQNARHKTAGARRRDWSFKPDSKPSPCTVIKP